MSILQFYKITVKKEAIKNIILPYQKKERKKRCNNERREDTREFVVAAELCGLGSAKLGNSVLLVSKLGKSKLAVLLVPNSRLRFAAEFTQ